MINRFRWSEGRR